MAIIRFCYLFLLCTFSQRLINCVPVKVNGNIGGDFMENVFRSIRSIIEDGPFDDNHSENETSDTPIILNKIIELPNGAQKFEKIIHRENEKDQLTEFFKFPNKTIQKMEGDGDDIVKREKSEIECIDTMDCNGTAYCDKLSYTCKSCRNISEMCHLSEQCCSGYSCDDGKCKKNEGSAEESCSSTSDCDKDHCCALDNNSDGICQPYLKDGDSCGNDNFGLFSSNSFMQEAITGLPSKCPCHPGLKCQKHQTFLFLDSKVCSKPKALKKTIIKIHMKRIPLRHFHKQEDEDDFPIPGLLSGDLPLFRGLKKHKLRKHGKALKKSNRYFQFPSQRTTHPRLKLHKRQLVTKRGKIPFPFADIMSPFSDLISSFDDERNDDNNEDDDEEEVKAETKTKRKRKRELIEDMSEDARDAVHDAVDGIFDSIMKGVIEAMKYRM